MIVHKNGKYFINTPSPLRGEGWGEGERTLPARIPLTLALSRGGRGK